MTSATLGVSDFQYCLALPPASGRSHRRRLLPGVFKELQSALQDRLTQVRAHDPLRPQRWWQDLLGAVARQRVQARRPRRCPRQKTGTRSAWPAKRTEDPEQVVPTFAVVPQGAAELQGIGLTPAGRRE